MKRWAWHFFCAASLLVFAISVGLFVFSWFARIDLERRSKMQPDPDTNPQWYGFSDYHIACSRGEILFARIRLDSDNFSVGFQKSNGISRPATTLLNSNSVWPASVSFAGFELYHAVKPLQSLTIQYHALTLPLWLFFFAAIPPWLWWRWRPARCFHGFPVTPTPMAPLPQQTEATWRGETVNQ